MKIITQEKDRILFQEIQIHENNDYIMICSTFTLTNQFIYVDRKNIQKLIDILKETL